MNKTLILLAGYPATGKSDLTARIVARHPGSCGMITPDEVKEEVWDECGFDDADEKARIELEVWKRYYRRLAELMDENELVISDYPFSDKQRACLEELAGDHGFQVVTVRLVGDPHVIYKRSLARDLSQGRHLGHLVNTYHKGDVLVDRTTADGLVTLEVFLDRCRTKGYEWFELGHLIEVDATNLASIDYPRLLDQIDELVTGMTAAERMAVAARGCELSDEQLAAMIDYTLLTPTATWSDIEAVCRAALDAGCASACIPPSFVARAHAAFPDLRICTVIGFPLGYATSEVKAFEAAHAVAQGASEVDMVVDLGAVRARDFDAVEADIATVRAAVPDAVLKVIIETCYLAQEEKVALCGCVSRAGADFIKTSTGFGSAGAQLEDIALFREHLDAGVQIKAAGGIRTRDALAAFAAAGCDRMGCSARLDVLLGHDRA